MPGDDTGLRGEEGHRSRSLKTRVQAEGSEFSRLFSQGRVRGSAALSSGGNRVSFRRIGDRMILSFVRLFPKRPARAGAQPLSRILVISTTAIGDTLLGTPALRALKETYPDCAVDVLVQRGRREVLKGNPHVDTLIPHHKHLIGTALMATRLRRRRYDAILVFHGNDPEIWPLAAMTVSPRIIGYARDTRFSSLLTDPVVWNGDLHTVEKRLELARVLKADTADRRLVLCLNAEDHRQAQRFLETAGAGENDRLIAFHIGAAQPYKCWPAERFARV